MATNVAVVEVSPSKRPIDNLAAVGDPDEAQAKRRTAAGRSRSVSPSPAMLEDAGAAAAQRLAISALLDELAYLPRESKVVPVGSGGDEASSQMILSPDMSWTLSVGQRSTGNTQGLVALPLHDQIRVVMPKVGGKSGSGNQKLEDLQPTPLEFSSKCDECLMPASQVLPTITVSSQDKSLVPSLRCFYCVNCYDTVLDKLMSSLETATVQITYTFVVDPARGMILRLPGSFLLSAKQANSSAVALVKEGRRFVHRFLTEVDLFLQVKTSETRGALRKLLESYKQLLETEDVGREVTLLHSAEVATVKGEAERLATVAGQAQASANEEKRIVAQFQATLQTTETARCAAEQQVLEAKQTTILVQQELATRRGEVQALQNENQIPSLRGRPTVSRL